MNDGQILAWVLGTIGGLGLLALPVALYRHAVKRQSQGWDYMEPVALPAGAYRGVTVEVPRSPGVPRVVRAASMWSLFMLVPAVVSLPLMLLGFVMMSAPAFVFGPLGVVLAFFIARAGHRLPQADPGAARFARSVAYAEVVHNVVVVGTVILATVTHESTWDLWSAEKLGAAALVYALVSFGHAAFLLHAVDVHERVVARDVAPDAPAELSTVV